MPVVHTIVNTSTTEDVTDKETILTFNIGAGSTALSDVPLAVGADGTTATAITGRVAVMITDESNGAGLSDVEIQCVNLSGVANNAQADFIDDATDDDAGGSVTDVIAANDADDTGDQDVKALAANCDLIMADIAANTEAIVVIYIDSWPEV